MIHRYALLMNPAAGTVLAGDKGLRILAEAGMVVVAPRLSRAPAMDGDSFFESAASPRLRYCPLPKACGWPPASTLDRTSVP